MSGTRRRVRAMSLAVVAALLAFVAVQFIAASSALAAGTGITGVASCANDGSYTVAWSATDSATYSETATVTGYQPAAASISPGSATIAAGASADFDQTGIAGTSTGASFTLHIVPTSGDAATDATGTITLDGTCAPTTHTATAPTGADGDCSYQQQPTITIPTDSDVDYAIDGTPAEPGTHPVTAGMHTVTATSSTLTLAAPTSFQFDLHAATGCVATVNPVAPQVLAADCSTGAPTPPGLILPTTTGVSYSVSRTGPYSSGQTVVVFATAALGNAFGSPASSGWIFVDPAHEKYDVTFPAPSGCTAPAPIQPTFADDVCVNFRPAGATYAVPSTVGVDYLVGGSVEPAGTYTAIDGSKVTVHVRAQPGYSLTATVTFEHIFSVTPMCKTRVVSAAPSFTPTGCTTGPVVASPAYTIPSRRGVTYTVNGRVTGAGTYPVNGSPAITVVAHPDAGYFLVGTTTWSHRFSSVGACPVSVVPAAVHFSLAACTVNGFSAGAYRVPRSTGVVYRVAGETALPGQHAIDGAQTVKVTAHARPGYTLSGRTSIVHTFITTAATCRAAESRGRHRTAPDSHGTAPVTSPAPMASAPVGLATTGAPVTELLLVGLVLLLMGAASLVGAAVRRRGPAQLFDTRQ